MEEREMEDIEKLGGRLRKKAEDRWLWQGQVMTLCDEGLEEDNNSNITFFDFSVNFFIKHNSNYCVYLLIYLNFKNSSFKYKF